VKGRAPVHAFEVLRAHARQLGKGNYAQRTGVTSNDEIGDLARDFDAMADAIQEREHRLIRSERLATVGRMAAHRLQVRMSGRGDPALLRDLPLEEMDLRAGGRE